MKTMRTIALLSICALGAAWLSRAQDPASTSSETVAKPKKTPDATEPDAAKIPSKFDKKDKDTPTSVPAFSTDAITVSVDVAVLDNKNRFIPRIPKNYFRVMEDNVPQQVTGYSIGEAPMTIALLIEFSDRFQQFYSETWFQTLTAAYGFLQILKPDDYVAIVAYDLRPEILSDFSTDRQQAYEAMQRLNFAGFSEANLFDALVDTAQRMQDIEGRKAIVLLSSGVDTFSKLTFDKARRGIQEAGVPIYAIGMMQEIRTIAETMGWMGNLQYMDFLQADNQMHTFAKESGGMSFCPRFYGEFPGIFRAIADSMRNQYVLTYTPSNQTRDGKYRRIRVELVNPDTNQPLPVKDEKGKPVKYQIIAKSGYTAPRQVE